MDLKNLDEIEELLDGKSVRPQELYALFDQRLPVVEPAKHQGENKPQIPWLQYGIALPLKFTRHALEKGEFLLVCDVAREAIRHWTRDRDAQMDLVRLRMNYAAALARLGFTRDARKELEPFVQDDFQPALGKKLKAEILLQLGNILRDESAHAAALAAKLQTAREALEFYKRSQGLDGERLDTLALIAAASLVLDGPGSELRKQAHETARRLLDSAARHEDDFKAGVQVTNARAVAHAVLGDIENAMQCYAALAKLGASTTELADARYYSRILAHALGQDENRFQSSFPPLQLVVFAGHVPDRPNEPRRFPREAVELARRNIRDALANPEHDVRVGLASAAAGADPLFVDELLARNGTVHVVLPWSREEFRKSSVLPFEPPGEAPYWGPLFDKAIENAATIRELGQRYEPSFQVGWQYMMQVNAGLAVHIARASRLDVQPMVLWDGQPGRGVGSTESFFRFWKDDLRRTPIEIDFKLPPPTVRRADVRQAADRKPPAMRQEVKSMLFADIVGYSKLDESVIPNFVGIFLARVSKLMAGSKHPPSCVNTWGDAVYAVFDSVRDAGCFALELTQMIEEGAKDWLAGGLFWQKPVEGGAVPCPLNIRIGLHTGPVFMHYDPIVRRLGYTGAHVNRAARIEPVTGHGEVFASEEFAALAELESEIRHRSQGDAADRGGADADSAGFVCEYAGAMHLAKGYPGRFRIYRVMPKRVFAVEDLARAAHDLYCDESRKRGETLLTNDAMRRWEDLSEDLRDANRAQVADIPNKLRLLGYELAPNYGLAPAEILVTDANIEALSIREHDRWLKERLDHGWAYAPKRDNSRLRHPLLVPWDRLTEVEKDKDRDAVRNLPRLIERAGFRVRKIPDAK